MLGKEQQDFNGNGQAFPPNLIVMESHSAHYPQRENLFDMVNPST